MEAALCFGVIILAAVVLTANADINVQCLKDSVNITWKVQPDLVPYAARLFLGNCMPSHFTILPTGEGEATFNYNLMDCKFKRLMKGKRLMYQNQLAYRPQSKSKPADFTYPVECVYERPKAWIPPFLIPGSGVSEGRGNLIFHMALLNEDLTGVATTNVVPLGSLMPIWAAVEQKSHQPLLLLMEDCVATSSPEQQPGEQYYQIIGNKGCLLASKWGTSRYLPRYHSSAITLYLQAFKLAFAEQVYIHCKLVAWDPESLSEAKKACQYRQETESWELLDDPYQSNICSCCELSCTTRSKRGVDSESKGLVQNVVLGPLRIVDQSDKVAQIVSMKSVKNEEYAPEKEVGRSKYSQF